MGWNPSQLRRGPGGVPSHLLCKRGGFIARIHTDSCSGNGLVGDQDLEGANLGYQRQEGLGKGHGDKPMGVAVAREVFYLMLTSTTEHPFSRDVKLNRQDGLARRHQPASVLSYPSLCTMAIDRNSHGSREGSQACPSTAAFHHRLPSAEADLAAATETDAEPSITTLSLRETNQALHGK